MSNWPTVPLGAAVELAYGKPLPKSMRSEGGEIPVYGSNGITGWHSEAVVNEPTVIVGRKGSAGAVQYVDGPCYPIDTTYFVRPRDGFAFDTRFLFYLLRWLDLSRLRTATGVPGLTREDAYRESIPVPPMSDQERIVDLLARAEGIVRLRREAQQKAAELIPAIFIDMFGDPATNPKRWPMSPIESICAVQTGATPLKEERRYYEGGTVPWIRTGEVRGRHIAEVEERITDLAVSETNCKIFPANTILVAMYGQGQTRGRAGFLKRPAATNQACAAILPSDRINAVYLFEALNLQYARLRAMGRGGNQANLNLGMIKGFQVPCPPIGAQLKFVERCLAMQSVLGQQAEATGKATATFDAILARAFGGCS